MTQIEKDKIELDIDLNDEDIKRISKYKFKKYLKKKIQTAALAYLNKLKMKHKKSSELQSKEIKCSEYLKSKLFTKNETKLLFKLRTHMYSVKENFSKQYENNMLCELCASAVLSQEH